MTKELQKAEKWGTGAKISRRMGGIHEPHEYQFHKLGCNREEWSEMDRWLQVTCVQLPVSQGFSGCSVSLRLLPGNPSSSSRGLYERQGQWQQTWPSALVKKKLPSRILGKEKQAVFIPSLKEVALTYDCSRLVPKELHIRVQLLPSGHSCFCLLLPIWHQRDAQRWSQRCWPHFTLAGTGHAPVGTALNACPRCTGGQIQFCLPLYPQDPMFAHQRMLHKCLSG